MAVLKQRENEDIEIQLLLEAIYLKYGYDFREYARASIRRRILRRLELSGMPSISAMQHAMLNDPAFFETLLSDFSINVTEMFRDPSFYRVLRAEIVPILRTYPFIKIWHAGCATGEEVYSMAILLQEEGLYDRTQIYATDFNDGVLQKAKDGIYAIENIKEYTVNYQKAGGTNAFVNYYTAKHEHILMNRSLKTQMVFANHNLASDHIFGEMNLILCRNVLIYFTKTLQNRVMQVLYESLCPYGFLCLGSKESLRFSQYTDHFEQVVHHEKIYKRKDLVSDL
jgi:chemotaxis protein methyltransferase CheR